MSRNSLVNPVHPELEAAKTNNRELKHCYPLEILNTQLEKMAELINIADGDYFIATEDATTKTRTSEFLTGIQADVISLSNRVFHWMLFPKLIELITQKHYIGWGQGDDTSWEITSISNQVGCLEPSATFMLHRWWLSSHDSKEFCRLTINKLTDAGQATARIDYLAADLKTVLQKQEAEITKYMDLTEWVGQYF